MRYSLALIAILFVSACVQFQGFFGQDVLTITRKVSEEGFKDILAVKDAKSIPSSPVLPAQQVLFTFIIENIDKTESAKNVVVDLFNAPLFKSTKQAKPLCNSPGSPCQPDICGAGCRILPGEQRAINFELLAPGEEEIARIKTDTELSYKVSYDFKGTLLYSVPVVDQEEVRSLQRQGKSVSLTEQVSHGSGPVQIDVQLFGTPYLLSRFSGTFIFNIKNKGKGNVVNSQIDTGRFTIEFPLELFGDGAVLTTPGDKKFTITEQGILGRTPEQTERWVLCEYRFPAGGTGMICRLGQCDAGHIPRQYFLTESGCLDEIKRQAGIPPYAPPLQQSQQEQSLRFSCKLTESKFSEDARSKKQIIACTNEAPVQLFRDETRTTLRFSISRTAHITEPFKTYLIRAFVDYKYELRNSFPITIRPFEK